MSCVKKRRKNRTGLLKPCQMNRGAVVCDCVFKLKQSVRMSKKHCWLRAFDERVLKKTNKNTRIHATGHT